MPRRSQGPRYYPSKKSYWANLQGEAIRLCDGPKNRANDKIAQERYEEEAQARKGLRQGDQAQAWAIFNAWLHWCANRTDPPPVAASTLEINTMFAQSFIDLYGQVPWKDLRPWHFDNWLAQHKQVEPHRGWGASTRRLAMNTLRGACNWASTATGLTRHNPLAMPGSEKLRHKRVSYRGKRLAITDEEHRALLGHALRRNNKDWACLLLLWYATGARPAELALARADEWDEGKQAFVIAATPENEGRFKLAHIGQKRIVYVPDYLVPLVDFLRRRRPEGLLFLNQAGSPFDKVTICSRMEGAREAINKHGEVIRDGIVAYSYRHAFVTRWLVAGLDPMKLCELLNTSLRMLHRHYSHLFEDHAELRQALNQLSAAAPSGDCPEQDDDEDEED